MLYRFHCYSMISILANKPLLTMPRSYGTYITCPFKQAPSLSWSQEDIQQEVRGLQQRCLGTSWLLRSSLSMLPWARKFSAAGRGFPGYWTPEKGQTWPEELWAKCVSVLLTHLLCPVSPLQALPRQGIPNQKCICRVTSRDISVLGLVPEVYLGQVLSFFYQLLGKCWLTAKIARSCKIYSITSGLVTCACGNITEGRSMARCIVQQVQA